MTAYLPENGKAAAERPSALPEPSAEVQGNVAIPEAEILEKTSGNGVLETVVSEAQNCSPSDTEMNPGTLQEETTDDASQENTCSEENDPFESKTSDENTVPESSENPSEGMIIPEEDWLITVAPIWQEIVQNAIDTRGFDENGGISLTIPEMCSVLCDDNFERDVPDLAGQFRQMIAEYDPGDG